MTIFSRITDIINANINALLERAEDPAKMIRLMIQEMEDTLVEVRSQSVRTIADKREIERKIERLETSGREWEDKAAFALGKGREDLARSALLVRRKLEDQAALLREELEVIEASLARPQRGPRQAAGEDRRSQGPQVFHRAANEDREGPCARQGRAARWPCR